MLLFHDFCKISNIILIYLFHLIYTIPHLKYIKLQHDDNSRILVVTHNGIMRIIKKFYLNEVNNIDSKNLGKFKMILKK